MTSELNYLTLRRVKMLKLIWSGIHDIDKLTSMMLTRKNVILRSLRTLKLYGLINYGSNSVSIVENPKNIALLIALNIAKPSDMISVMFKNLKSAIEGYGEVNVESMEFTPNVLRVKIRHSIANVGKLKAIERGIKELGKEFGFETIKVEFIKDYRVESLELNDERSQT